MNSKKTGLNLVVAVLIVVFAVANLILFLTVGSARLESAVFWIAWAFTFPVTLSLLSLLAYGAEKRAEWRSSRYPWHIISCSVSCWYTG